MIMLLPKYCSTECIMGVLRRKENFIYKLINEVPVYVSNVPVQINCILYTMMTIYVFKII